MVEGGGRGLARRGEERKLLRVASGLERGGELILAFEFEKVAAQGVELRVQIVSGEVVDFGLLARRGAGQHGVGLPVGDPCGLFGAGPVRLPVSGKGRVHVQEDLRAVPPEEMEQRVFRAGEHAEARQQDGASGEEAGQRREFVLPLRLFQQAGDHEGVEAGRGEVGLDQRVAVAPEDFAERAEQGRAEGRDFALGVQHVLGREPLCEAFLQQVRQPHAPREEARLVGLGELHAQVGARFGQLADAAGEQSHLIQPSGLATKGPLVLLTERGHEFALREHARDEAGLGYVRRVAEAFPQVAPGTVVHEYDHRVAGLAARGLHHPVFQGVQKIGVPRDDAEGRAGCHGDVPMGEEIGEGRNISKRFSLPPRFKTFQLY